MNDNERMIIGEQCEEVEPQTERFKQNKKMVDDMFKELEDETTKKKKYSFLSKEDRDTIMETFDRPDNKKYTCLDPEEINKRILSQEEMDALLDAADEAFDRPDREIMLLHTNKCIHILNDTQMSGTFGNPTVTLSVSDAESIKESLQLITSESRKIK